MPRRLKIVLFAALTALIVVFAVFPFVRQKQCTQAGGVFDRATLTCTLAPSAPVRIPG